MIFVDYAVNKDCKNPDSYGMICVHCNKCGRFDEHKKENKTDEVKER